MKSRLAPATVRTSLGVLRTVFNAAVAADILVRSPCRGIKLAPEQRRERPLLEPEVLGRLAAAMPPEYRPMVYLAGALGLRWSEVIGLRVRDLDFLGRTLTVAQTIAEVNGQLAVAETKTRAGRRTISVPVFLMDVLAEHLARRGRPDLEELAFVSPSGGPMRATNFRRRVWAPAVAEVGLEGVTFHGLRHVATSYMVATGEHPRVVQHRLGHADARLSMGLYAHVPESADRAAAGHLEELFRSADGRTVVGDGNRRES